MTTRFAARQRGAIAIVFALLLIPLMLAAAFGVDAMYASAVRAELKNAVDSAALAATRAKSQNQNLTDAQARAIALSLFNANNVLRDRYALDSFDLRPDASGEAYALTVDGALRPFFLSVGGPDRVALGAAAEARFVTSNALEAVLVLDTTYSMNGAKLDALKSAARDMTTRVMGGAAADVKMSIVPFANYVNVGASRRGAPWLDAPADRTENVCRNTYPNKTGCRNVTTTCTSNRDGVRRTRTCTRRRCSNRGAPVQRCEQRTTTWRGCVGSRNPPYDARDEAFASLRAPGLLDVSCPNPFLPLTRTQSAVIGAINGLVADGETYLPAGLTWGLRLISDVEPFVEGEAPAAFSARGGQKAIVLMTDGENTKSATYPRHNGASKSAADAKTLEVCREVKSQGVALYTIAFEVDDAATKNLLENCATAPSDYFDANDAAQLTAAFQTIAERLQALALTR